jgi:hypothetical protein
VTAAGWRNLALVLAAICGIQLWHGCTRAASTASKTAASESRATSVLTDLPSPAKTRSPDRASSRAADDAPAETARSFYGVKIPAWVLRLLPQPGEDLRDYRDRMLPLAQGLIAPQRARVARMRDDFAALDAHQRAELDGAVQEAAGAIRDRVTNAILSGELRPATFKPMTGVALARDVLDIVDHGNTRFQNSLTPDQRTRLASHRFDFADYLAFSARWEDALGVRDPAAAR